MRYNRRAYKKLIIPSEYVKVGDYLSTGRRADELVVSKELREGNYIFEIGVCLPSTTTVMKGYIMDMGPKAKMHVLRFSLKDLLKKL